MDEKCSFCNLQREAVSRGRERDRELETSMRKKHRPAASCTPSTGDVPATKDCIPSLDSSQPTPTEELSSQGQSNTEKIECQAENYLNALFRKKGMERWKQSFAKDLVGEADDGSSLVEAISGLCEPELVPSYWRSRKKPPQYRMDKFSKDIESSDDEFYFENEEKSEKCNSDESEFSEDESGDDEQIAGPSGTTERKKSPALPKDLAESTDSDSDIEFIKAKRRRTIVYSNESDGDIGDIIEKSGIRPSESYVSRGKQEKEKWTSTSVNDKEPSRIPFSTGQLQVGPQVPSGCATPIDFFQLFFTETLIKNITDETNEYARHKISQKELSQRSTWNNWKDVTIEEMKAFLGVILNMGVLNHPNLQSYWSMDFESHIPFFRSVFKRERFLQIFWMLHLKHDQKSSKDLRTRTEKVNCFLSYLEMKFRERFCPGREIAVDEAVVGFKGKIHFITYNPKKPTKWGIRLYVLSDSKCGYIHSFVPYYGGITSETLVRPDLPFTSRIVLELHERLKNSVPGSQGYHFFTDRYYTSVTLAKELFKEKTHLTGTIMPNRKDNPPVIKHPKLMKGEIVAFRDENVMLLAWKDKRIVTMLSTWDTSETESVERRVRGGGKEIVLKPKVVTNYTKFMGGVDIADHYTGTYCFMRKTLKWWRKLFFWGLEVSVVNSYILYKECQKRKNEKPITHVKFIRKLVHDLVGEFRDGTLTSRGRLLSTNLEQRLDGKLHIITPHPNKKHKDCVVCSNRKIKGGRRETIYICETCECKPGLHVGECFKKYHTMKNYRD